MIIWIIGAIYFFEEGVSLMYHLKLTKGNFVALRRFEPPAVNNDMSWIPQNKYTDRRDLLALFSLVLVAEKDEAFSSNTYLLHLLAWCSG